MPPSYRKLVMTTHPVDAPVHWVGDNETDTPSEEIVSVNQPPYAFLPPFLIIVTQTNVATISLRHATLTNGASTRLYSAIMSVSAKTAPTSRRWLKIWASFCSM